MPLPYSAFPAGPAGPDGEMRLTFRRYALTSHSQTPAGNQDELVWTVWPAGQRPHAAAAVVALILGVSW